MADLQTAAYELPEIWQDEWFGEDDRERVRRVAALIPPDVESLLDAGCGNGLFLRAVASGARPYLRLAGVDRSEAALRHLPTEKQVGSLDALPCRDREFDAVTCMEVLEHLPVDVYPRALAELARVARRYVVISVPYKEDLEAGLTTCPTCCTRFSADYHVRRFDERTMQPLFDGHGFRQVSVNYLGETTVFADQAIRQWLRAVANPPAPYPPYAVCPVCGYHAADQLREELARRTRGHQGPVTRGEASPLRSLLSPILPKRTRYRWICAVYERDQASVR